MKHQLYLLVFFLMASQCRTKEPTYTTIFPGKPAIPSTIKKEHDSLLRQIQALTAIPDSTGIVAAKLHELMQHHFMEEEEYVLPPLGLLPALASGELPEQSKEVIQLTDKLRTQLAHMSAEHQLVKVNLAELKKIAGKDHQDEITSFENEILHHAVTEEEIYFPAAIVVGDYLTVKILPAN